MRESSNRRSAESTFSLLSSQFKSRLEVLIKACDRLMEKYVKLAKFKFNILKLGQYLYFEINNQ